MPIEIPRNRDNGESENIVNNFDDFFDDEEAPEHYLPREEEVEESQIEKIADDTFVEEAPVGKRYDLSDFAEDDDGEDDNIEDEESPVEDDNDYIVKEEDLLDEVEESSVEPEPVVEKNDKKKIFNWRDKRLRDREKDEKKSGSKESEKDHFIDKKNKKLLPFGKKKYSAKVSDFDERKNLRRRSIIVQWVLIALVLGLVGLGVKNAIIPPDMLTVPEVNTLIDKKTGETGFPMQKGAGFAEDFVKAFLTIDTTDQASLRVLGYYYTGTTMKPVDYPNRVSDLNVKQKILYGPTLYDSEALTEYSARFVFAALVEKTIEKSKAPTDGSTAEWIFLNVNVYYDEAKEGLLITPDSPAILPNIERVSSMDIPDKAGLGSGTIDFDLTEQLKSVVQGFIKGYAVSSSENYSDIEQYIISDPPASLLTGLNKRFTLEDSIESSIEYKAYPTDDPNEVKVSLKVFWYDNVVGKSRIKYTSNYVMTLAKQDNGKYLVSRFAPEYYVKE